MYNGGEGSIGVAVKTLSRVLTSTARGDVSSRPSLSLSSSLSSVEVLLRSFPAAEDRYCASYEHRN